MADLRHHRAARRTGRSVLAVSLVAAAALSAVLYAAATSIPFIATVATADPHFGAINACLIRTLDGARLGFAVSAEGSVAATYGESAVAICDRGGRGRRVVLPGIQAAAFDGEGGLWLSASRLWRLDHPLAQLPPDSEPVQLGSVVVLALAGTASGAALIEGQGRLLSISPSGRVQGLAELPDAGSAGKAGNADEGGMSIAVAPGGRTLAAVAGGWVSLYRLPDLKLLRRQAPCSVERAIWQERPNGLLLACGGAGDPWGLELATETGGLELAEPPPEGLTRLWEGTLFAQPCEGLPCTGMGR